MALDAARAIDKDESRKIEHEAAVLAKCYEAIAKRLPHLPPAEMQGLVSTLYIQLRRR